MRIKGLSRIIYKGRDIETMGDNLLFYSLDDGRYFNGVRISPAFLSPYLNYGGGLYLRSSEPSAIYCIDPQSNNIRLCALRERRIRLGISEEWLLLGRYKNRQHTYTLEVDKKVIWDKTVGFSQVVQIGDYALLSHGSNELKSRCQLITLSTGSTIWEIDYPGAFIKHVYPYADKVVIVWFTPLGPASKDRVLCVEVPSGKVLWENNTAGNYHKYGENKLVCFISFYRNEEEDDDNNHSYAEIDVQTGSVYIHKYPGYRSSVERNYVYKDFLFYAAARGDAYVGAIDLRTHKMIDEVMIDFTPGDFNQTKDLGIYAGQLYVEVQTDLDHSDIHVFDLEEE